MKELVDLIITVNSPGEVSGWLKPVADALEAVEWPVKLTVFIPPCPFASGAECEVVQGISKVDTVIGPRATVRYLVTGIRPRAFHPIGQGVVLFLGGDLTYAALLAKKLRYPAVAYTEGLVSWEKSFARFAVPYPWMASKIEKSAAKAKTVVIGNLMLDAIKPSLSPTELRGTIGNHSGPGLLLAPGSRPAHFHYMLGFFIKAAEKMREILPTLTPAVSISPFVTERQIRAALASPGAQEWGLTAVYVSYHCEKCSWQKGEPIGEIQLKDGLKILCFQHHQYDLMNWADLALTIPGTNTIELAYMGVPMIVTVPLNHPEEIPLEGPAGLIGGIPFLGKALKKRLLPKFHAKIKYTAWPNRLANELVVPELIGRLTPAEVARTAVRMLKDQGELLHTSQHLQKLVGTSGAARRLVGLLQEVMNEFYSEQ